VEKVGDAVAEKDRSGVALVTNIVNLSFAEEEEEEEE
jgi:hypothetical protein